MTNRELRKALLKKLGASKQAMYQQAGRIKKKYRPISTEDAIYWLAVDKGIDVSKFLDKEDFDRIRQMRLLQAPQMNSDSRGLAPRPAVSPAPTRDTARTPAALFNARDFHSAVSRRSRKLFVDGHNKDAIRAAFQSVNNRVKRLSGLSRDGQPLMSDAFKEANSALQMSDLTTDSEINEHNGIRFLMMGAMTGMRNPRAHEDKWEPDDDVAAVLDALSFASLLHRFLDRCELYRSVKSLVGP